MSKYQTDSKGYMNNIISKSNEVITGVPHGTILSPLLFMLYVKRSLLMALHDMRMILLH